MVSASVMQKIQARGRYLETAEPGKDELGPLKWLPGRWANVPNLPGRGWNMIALPFANPQGAPYRLLVNQYNEELVFDKLSGAVPNRGIGDGPPVETDQLIMALDYAQTIKQIAADDQPVSGKAGDAGLDIHHEPGLFLYITNHQTTHNGKLLDVARLGTIPHGDSLLALGHWEEIDGPPVIPDVSGFPIGGPPEDSPYFDPYHHYRDNPFLDLFDPNRPAQLLAAANQGVDIVKTTVLDMDTTIETGGIKNIPFVVKEANAAEMKSTFWIQELAEKDEDGNPKLRLQYLQIIMLDFFDRRDGMPGLIRWPHISINTMEKVGPAPSMS